MADGFASTVSYFTRSENIACSVTFQIPLVSGPARTACNYVSWLVSTQPQSMTVARLPASTCLEKMVDSSVWNSHNLERKGSHACIQQLQCLCGPYIDGTSLAIGPVTSSHLRRQVYRNFEFVFSHDQVY